MSGLGTSAPSLEAIMTRTMLTGLALLGLLACGKSNQDIGRGDSAGRDLELAPTGGGHALNDRPVSYAATTRTLPAGSIIAATMSQTITSRSNKVGETVTTTVDADVKDAAGRVVIPAGSTVELTITDIKPAKNKSQADGTLTLQVTGVTVRGRRYPIAAEVTSVSHTLQGRGVTAGEVEKVAVGTAIGAVAGRVIGGNTKGAIVGGAVGAAGGTVVAIQTASRDVVMSTGTPVAITLTGPLTVAST
jgi:hypothetical protein